MDAARVGDACRDIQLVEHEIICWTCLSSIRTGAEFFLWQKYDREFKCKCVAVLLADRIEEVMS